MDMKQVLQAVQSVPTNRRELGKGAFTLTNGAASDRSLVAEYQAQRPLAVRPGARGSVSIVTHERFTTDGTASNTETFTLSHDVVDAGSVAQPVVTYVGGTKDQSVLDSVDYAGNTIDVTDPGTNNDLDVFYTVGPGDQAKVEIVKAAPKDITETLWTGDAGLLNARDQNKRALTFDFTGSPFEPIVPRNWRLQVYVDGPYATEWDDSSTGTPNGVEATNALLTVPVNQAQRQIEPLGTAVRHDIADK